MSESSWPEKLRIGTRGSELALVQARLTAAALRAQFPEMELEEVVISTTGDERQDLRLAQLTDAQGKALDKGVFTKELEAALLAGEIDLAVHSAKDVPTELPEGLVLSGCLPRAATQDVLILAPEWDLPESFEELLAAEHEQELCLGTSSVRRAAILAWRGQGNLKTVDIRGNVPTRLRKLRDQAELDGIVLARAGLERLGHEPSSGKIELDGVEFPCLVLADEEMLSAAGQGAVVWQTREEDVQTRASLLCVSHPACWIELQTERSLLAKLQAGCQTPLSARAVCAEGRLSLRAWEFEEREKQSGKPRQAFAELGVRADLSVEEMIEAVAEAVFSLLRA